MAEISDLAPNAALNTARFPEGQLVPSLNNGARELEAILARWFLDTNGSVVTSGSANAYAILTNRAVPSYEAGLIFVVRFHQTNTGASTFKVNNLAVKPLKRHGGKDLAPGDIATGQIVIVAYNTAGDYFECIGIGDGAPVAPVYAVADLPSSPALGQLAFAHDGRKAGEGEGDGTGVLCFYDGTAWRACDTGATVAA